MSVRGVPPPPFTEKIRKVVFDVLPKVIVVSFFFRYPVMKTDLYFFGTGGKGFEWLVKKGLGRVRVAIQPDLTADVIVTHAVAEHQKSGADVGHDVNINKRIIQAKKIISYVKKLEAATNPADLVILGGDLNSQPDDPAYSVISSMFTDTGKGSEKREATFGHPENTFISDTGAQSTLDYIFVRHQSHVLLRANQSVSDFK